MNRIITINIGGIAIQIEEDAYEVLQKYLSKIKSHFANTANGSEIIEDIEARIAEMLFELLNKKPSINVEDINQVIEVMGNPTEFDAEEEEDQEFDDRTFRSSKKSLFRDPERGLLGGVCSGLSYYLGIEVVAIRIIWVILFFFFGTGFLLYILLWFIIPKAESTADRIKMMGETPNINNIKNTIRDEANEAYENIKNSGFSEKVKDVSERIGQFGLRFMGGIGKTIFGFLGVAFFLVFIAIVAHLVLGQSLFNIDVPWLNREKLGQVYNNGFMFWVTLSSFYLLILVPIARLIIGLLQVSIRGIRKTAGNRSMRTGLRYLFFFSLIILVLSSMYTYSLFSKTELVTSKEMLQIPSDTLYLKRASIVDEDLMKIDQNVKLYIHYSPDSEYRIEVEKASKGRNEDEALDLVSEIAKGYTLDGSTINFQRKVLIPQSSSYREQKLRYDLYVPNHTVLYIGDKLIPILRSSKNVEGLSPYKMRGEVFEMTPLGLKCISCDSKAKNRDVHGDNIINEEFDKISINEWIKATIIYGPENSVYVEGEGKDLDDLIVKVENRKLKIYNRDKDYIWDRFRDKIELVITCTRFDYLQSNGASEITLEGFVDQHRVKVELNGATVLRTQDLNIDHLDLEVNGAAVVNLAGKGRLLEIESNGASTISAYEYDVEEVDLQISGAASCYIKASEQIKGKAAGLSRIRYKGKANVDVEVDGLASFKRAG
jgi:phage shock protein PspC (stress-responsive transcriptional regulator)